MTWVKKSPLPYFAVCSYIALVPLLSIMHPPKTCLAQLLLSLHNNIRAGITNGACACLVGYLPDLTI